MTKIDSGDRDLAFSETTKIAVLDIGSNSFHFIIGESTNNSVHILYRLKQKVRLADGLSETKVLSNDAIERGLAALEKIAHRIKAYQPQAVKVVGTYTLRNAVNINEFLDKAKQVFDYPIDILSGDEEASLIYKGVAKTETIESSTLVIDIGGGSTEFVVGKNENVLLTNSLDMGCVSYSNAYFPDNKLTDSGFELAISAAKKLLMPVAKDYELQNWQVCLGTSGSIESLVSVVAIKNKTKMTDHALTYEDLLYLKALCIEAGDSEQLQLGEKNECRKHVFAAGLSIMIAAFEVLDIKSLKITSAALREGVLFEVAEELKEFKS